MELKFVRALAQCLTLARFNCTFMELKSAVATSCKPSAGF